MATIVDTVRDRWEGISPRERKLVVLLGMSFVVVIVIYLALEISDGLAALEARNAKTRRALLALADLRARGKDPTTTSQAPKIPAEPVKLESYLNRTAEKVGIKIRSFNPRTNPPKNGFITHAMQIDLRDLTVKQVGDLLEAIETDNKLVLVTSLTIDRNFGDKDKLDVRMVVSTYATEAKPAAGKATGTGTGSAAPAATGQGG